MREREIEKYLRKRVLEHGGRCYKFLSNEAGVPDRIVILDGHVVFIELKTDDGELSKIQRKQHANIKQAGGDVMVIRSKTGVDCFFSWYK